MAPTNLLTKDGANQSRYILAYGSGINASPTVIGHTIVTDTGESGIVVASTSSIRVTGIGVLDIIQATASALNATVVGAIESRQSNASALKGTMEVYQSSTSALKVSGEFQQLTASALKATAEVYQSSPSALRATAEIYQATASALQITATQSVNASGWTVRVVTPSGDTAMSTTLSAVRIAPATVFDIIQGTASALNATVTGTVSVSANNLSVRLQDGAGVLLQSGASDPVNTDKALIVRNIPSGSQAITGSVSITGVVDMKQTTASALNATVVGAVEVRQSNGSALSIHGEVQQLAASALKATAEVYQATASALNATVSQATDASGWTVRVVTPSGDTAMIASTSSVRVHVVNSAGGEVAQSNASALQATAEVRQATASALNATIVGNVASSSTDSGNPIKLGGNTVSHGVDPAGVAAAARTDWYFNRHGIPFVMGGHPNITSVEFAWNSAKTDASMVVVGAGSKIIVTRISVVLDQAVTAGVAFRMGLGDTLTTAPGDGGTASGILLSHTGLVPGGGITVGDGAGILGIGPDGGNLTITAGAAPGGSGRAYASYYTVPS